MDLTSRSISRLDSPASFRRNSDSSRSRTPDSPRSNIDSDSDRTVTIHVGPQGNLGLQPAVAAAIPIAPIPPAPPIAPNPHCLTRFAGYAGALLADDTVKLGAGVASTSGTIIMLVAAEFDRIDSGIGRCGIVATATGLGMWSLSTALSAMNRPVGETLSTHIRKSALTALYGVVATLVVYYAANAI